MAKEHKGLNVITMKEYLETKGERQRPRSAIACDTNAYATFLLRRLGGQATEYCKVLSLQNALFW